MHADSLTDLIKPLAWVAAFSFTLGFCGYLAIGLNSSGLAG
jgi:hypothetical protein